MIRVLATAFGAFLGAPSNPTIAILRALERRHGRRLARLSIVLETRVLPVRFADVGDALAEALAQARPDVVLHLGLAGRRKTLSVELRARNRLGLLRPDAARALAPSAVVETGAPHHRPARWPARRIKVAMDRKAATSLSIDAGDYVCNQTLYLSLSRTRGLVGFLHIPRPGAGGRRRPGLDDMVEAAATAAITMACAARPALRKPRT